MGWGKSKKSKRTTWEGQEERAEGPSGHAAQLPGGAAGGAVVPQEREKSGCVELQADVSPGAESCVRDSLRREGALVMASHQWAPELWPRVGGGTPAVTDIMVGAQNRIELEFRKIK